MVMGTIPPPYPIAETPVNIGVFSFLAYKTWPELQLELQLREINPPLNAPRISCTQQPIYALTFNNLTEQLHIRFVS